MALSGGAAIAGASTGARGPWFTSVVPLIGEQFFEGTTAAELPELAPPPDPNRTLIHVDAPLLNAARDFFYKLAKGLKQIALYQHLPAKFPEYLHQPFSALSDLLQGREVLMVKVQPHDFTMGDHSVLPADLKESLAFRFFRDGVRRLSFRAGVTLDELVTFARIVSQPSGGDDSERESLLEQVWAADLAHIEQLVVESLDLPNVSAEQMQLDIDEIVGYLAHTLRATDGAERANSARLRASDLSLRLEALEQQRTLDVEAGIISPALRARLKVELPGEEPLLAATVVRALLETVSDGVEPSALQDLKSFLVKILDTLLLHEDFPSISRIYERLSQLGPPLDAVLFDYFREKMAEADRLSRVAAIVRSSPLIKFRRELLRYLNALPATAVPALLRELETIESTEGRELMRDALATIGRDTPEPFVARLAVANSTLAVDVLHILARQRVPGRVRYLEQAMQNPNSSVRLEVVSAARALHPEAARSLLFMALRDEHPKVRALAATRLAEVGARNLFSELQPLLANDAFFAKPSEERWALYLALASTRERPGLDLLIARSRRPRGLFAGGKHLDDRLLALEALATWPSLIACETLMEIAEDHKNPPQLRTAAAAGADRVQLLLQQHN